MYNTWPLSARARSPTRTPRSPRTNSHSTGRSPTKFSQLAPAPQRTPRTDLYRGKASVFGPSFRYARRRCSPARMSPMLQALGQPPQPWRLAEVFAGGWTQYVLNSFSKKSPPYHVIQDDVSTSLQRLEVEKITGHQSVRGRGGVITVMHETHWTGLSRPSREREVGLQFCRPESLRY